MATRAKGHNAVGRNKIFRAAVEEVHVGVGHAVLGNVALRLAVGSAETAHTPHTALYEELNAQLLANSAKEFKQLRWEILEWCETPALFAMHQLPIAEKLISKLLDRRGGSFSASSTALARSRAAAATSSAVDAASVMERGALGEGFEAFVRLTVAFARDCGDRFLPFFEAFHQAVNAGIYDKQGALIADTATLQLIYAAQVAWCRELSAYWELPEHHAIVGSILRIYLRQLCDTKEYVRRLTAEVLAFLCRQHRPLLRYVVEEACAMVLETYSRFVEESAAGASSMSEASAMEQDGEEVVDGPNNAAEENEDEDEARTTSEEMPSPQRLCGTAETCRRFTADSLSVHPVVDGLTFFVAELFRGMQGSLSSSFELHYYAFLRSFLLLPSVKTVQQLRRLTRDESLLTAILPVADEEEVVAVAAEAMPMRGIASSGAWAWAFDDEASDDVEGAERRTTQEVIRHVGLLCMGGALQRVLHETKKHSASREDDDSDDSHDDDEDKDVHHVGAADARPSHRLLQAVLGWLQPADPLHLRLLLSITQTADGLLWRDAKERHNLGRALTSIGAACPNASPTHQHDVDDGTWQTRLDWSAAVMELLLPLCFSIYRDPQGHLHAVTSDSPGGPTLNAHQKAALPVGRAVCAYLVRLACPTAEAPAKLTNFLLAAEAAQRVLCGYVQDVLQKHYHLALAEERRLGEEEDLQPEDEDEDGNRGVTAPTSRVVSSALTPLALTLLHGVCTGMWGYAGELLADDVAPSSSSRRKLAPSTSARSSPMLDVLHQRTVERALLLARLANDRTRHMRSCPLAQLLRLKTSAPAAAKPRRSSGKESATTETSAGVELWQSLRAMVQHLATAMVGHLGASNEHHHSTLLVEPAYTARLLSCAVPLIYTLVGNGRRLAEVAQLRQVLSEVIAAIQDPSSSASTHATRGRRNTVDTLTLSTANYDLYAHITAILVHLTTTTTTTASSGSSQGAATDVTSEEQRTAALNHLCRTISLLAVGFEGLHTSTNEAVDVQPLLSGTERLLESLGWFVGLHTAMDGAQTSHKQSLTAGMRAAVLLRSSLPVEVQRSLVSVILPEALSSPVQALRVAALRLLRLLCQPAIAETRGAAFLEGLAAVEPVFFDRLIRAEEYNPLSSSGNLDGMQQALASVVFAAEAGTMVEPLPRVLLARAMMGLLHMKFSGAWPIATRILAALLRREGGASTTPTKDEDRDEAEEVPTAAGRRLDPLVWEKVVRPLARRLTFGDESSTSVKRNVVGDELGAGTSSAEEVAEELTTLEGVPTYYLLRLSDQQRYEMGEASSKRFALTAYHATTSTLLHRPTEDGELMTWAHYQRAAVSLTSAASTDAATVAQTFLQLLAEVMSSTRQPTDAKVVLVEELLTELASVARHDHPTMLQLRRVEDRLHVAMQACAQAPTIVLSAARLQRRPPAEAAALTRRAHELTSILLPFLSSSNARLQRATLDNLKRLKLEPFLTHHAHLTPYTDPSKALFAFLNTFHVESDVPAHSAVNYICAAFSVALPKLIGTVSKEKMRDQVMLRRRMMSFVAHLSTHNGSAAVEEVLAKLVDQIVFARIRTMPDGASDDGGDGHHSVWCNKAWMAELNFLETWSDSLTDRRRHPIRRLEHQVKQLISAIQLLESLLHAVGKKFSVFIAPCLHLVLQAYLLASKDQLRRPLLAQMEAATAAEDEAALAYFRPLLRTLDQHGGLTNALAPLRRASITVAALLFEQFPEESMAAVRADVAASPSTSEALLGRYLRALVANSKGITLRAASSSSAMLAAASSSRRGGGASGVAKAQVTPVLRLMTAWVQAPELLPLMPAFAEEVLATLEEVFATNTAASGGASVHRAASATIYQGLRLVADVLSLGEVEVELLASADESAVKKKKKVATSTSALPTLRTVFLKPYVERIFATLYRLIMCGSASERQEAARSSSSRALSAKKNTVMRFSVAMWREIMQTVSKLVQHIAIVGTSSALQTMMERLLDISLQFVSHPLCAADASTAKMAVDVVLHLAEELPTIDSRRHVSALAHLLNAVTAPAARKTLCEVVRVMAAKMEVVECVARYGEGATTEAYTAQLHTTARVVECLNRFTTDDQYDYDLRFHTFNALLSFFARGREGAEHHPPTTRRAKKASAQEAAVRRERAYAGAEDVALPVSAAAPVLCVEALHLIAANLMFFLRDAEATIRGLAQQVLQAMLAYAGGSTQTNTKTKKTEDKEDEGSDYATLILHEVVRREVLPSLRRGSVARDVRIRQLHLASFGALAQHFPSSFPSFRVLYATNPADSFYANVIHVMPSARLHALAILRREAAHLQVRDVLRVFVPFLLSAVKDFATGKRQLENMSEGRERGYCEAVLLTIASLCEHLPWEAYYRVLSLFLANASANAALRMPMLRGVVQVLSHFRFLEEEAEKEKSGGVPSRAAATTHDDDDDDENDDDEEDVEDEDEAVRAEMQSKRRLYHRAKVMRVLEDDIIPQLYGYIGQGKKNSGGLGELKGSNANTISSVRREQAKEDAGATKNALLQLPVAVAIVKIVRHFPDERFTFHTEFLMNEVVQKLRTKNDKHRESARRILAAMLQETGPSKLGFVVRKLKDNLVHGYQLHVLGYTVVTLLMQLYEPERAAMDGRSSHSSKHARKLSSATITGLDPVQEALGGEPPRQQRRHDKATTTTTRKNAEAEADADAIVEQQEEDFLEELLSRHGAIRFDREEGVRYLTHIMDDLMLIFLDDYLGEVGMQKEQVELMSTMVEVKRNRALQGFSFLGTHCEAGPVLEAFLHRITWVLTPPSDTTVDVHDLHGSARARALIMRELRSKYMTISKNAGADLVFVNKVRSLAIRVARSLLSNPTMEVDASFAQVRDLLQRHNTVRAEKIEAFEAKDGTRRIRGNAHVLIHCAERRSWKELLDRTYAVAPVPERVDVDFSAHTVLATQQKQKLRVYRGLYGKEVRAAAKDFYRDDPTTAVVLDTLDEFLLRYLLSVLKQVLGIGKERRYSKAALKLDLVRHHHKSATAESEDDEAEEDEEASHNDDEEDEEDEEVGDEEDGGAPLDSLAPRSIGADEGDELDDFADAQVAMDEAEAVAAARGNQSSSKKASKHTATFSVAQGTDLAATFTREHRTLLESLVPTVLSTLEGEGSDAVVATALDCLLALISLRPPLDAVHELESSLFDTITSYFGRGGPIKQRAMRVCSALVSQQKFVLAESHASQLIKIIRAEMMDRSSFLPMALSLLYAILGKHVHVVEIYNLMDLITEMLIHLASKRIIRTRCIVILVRFLMEYRLTPDKFRSHIDLICRNLDFPELGGRLALLDLIHALVERLPSAVLRSEAPVLLLPLAATLQSAEWPACRERAGVVLQQLVRCAGIDVLQPLLATWMDPSSPRSTKTNAMQVWATFLPAIAKAYGLPQTTPTLGEDDDEAESSYAACCTWSVEAVLHGCGVGTAEASCALPAQAKAKAEMKSWMLHYFGLRCAEAMIEAAPATFVPLLMPTLLPVVERWVLHSHAWIQAAALRILRLYCYNYVEPRCHYLASSVTPVVEMACARRGGATTKVVETEEAESMPFLLPQLRIAEDGRVRGSIPFTERALQAVMSLVKHLLNRLTSCDVADEKYHAHRAMEDPARAESLKVLVFLTKAAMQLSGVLVLLSGRPSSSSASRHYAHTTAVVQRHMEQLRRQLHSLAAPIIKQQHINNYMVRSATLIQYCGGLISVLPLPHGEEEEESSPTSAVLHEDVARTEKWLVQDGLHALELARTTVVPLLLVGLGTSADTSVKIANYAHQASQVVRQQLEARRALFQPTSSSSTSRSGSKRQREEMEEVSLEAVLSSLTVGLSGLKEEAARQRVSAEARKMLKRNRHATKMAIVAKKTAAKSSSTSSASSTKRTRR